MVPSPEPASAAQAPLLAVRRLGIEFHTRAGRRTAVRDLDLTVEPGRVLALVGESGSGKSVTAMALLGLLPPTAEVTGSAVLDTPERGRVELIGADPGTLRSVRGRRIGTVFQEPFTAFNPVLRLGDQIVEAIRAHRPVARAEALAEALALLERVGLPDPRRILRSYPHQVSGGQLQRTMIAMAISGRPELLVADEPTTALDVTVQAGILDLLRELRDDLGTAILLITHDMGVVADIADDVLVLRNGVLQETGTAGAVFSAPRADYSRMLLAAVPRVDLAGAGLDAAAASPADGGTGGAAAEVRGLTVSYGAGRHRLDAVDGVDLAVPTGRTLGLVGESGSGKSTLGRALARLVPAAEGSVMVAGHELGSLSASDLRRARARIGFVFQNPAEALNPRARVSAIVAEPLALHTRLGRTERRERAAALLARVSLPADAIDRHPHELSGGERQRVAIARALVLEPSLVIADEPTSALDVSVQATILELFAELQRELGFSCLFISHDLAVVRAVSQEVAVMRSGRIVEHGPTDRVLGAPRDPYTRALLAAVPVPDPELQRRRRDAARRDRLPEEETR
ncbi:MAG: ABC transporter ATP-binding protein [Propionicimonas sp.]|uniref:dipeptide ABC transporter ATP-binding protein n=1 Tax=Propionicimonas sp. TaxID=1955623 RepID=UPI003D145B84